MLIWHFMSMSNDIQPFCCLHSSIKSNKPSSVCEQSPGRIFNPHITYPSESQDFQHFQPRDDTAPPLPPPSQKAHLILTTLSSFSAFPSHLRRVPQPRHLQPGPHHRPRQRAETLPPAVDEAEREMFDGGIKGNFDFFAVVAKWF